jgi:hypothetical protein
MGGMGSGRWKKPGRRRTVDSCWALDAERLSAMGCLQPGWSGAYPLAAGDVAPSIRLHCEAGRFLFLSYALAAGAGGGEGEREDVTEIVSITRLPWRFGGSLPYFLCPGGGGGVVAAGVGCGRRVRKLYLSGRYFLCRHCSKLIYASPYDRQPWQLASRRANKLRQRLGITGLGVSEKPSGMLVADYERLLEATLQAEILETEACTARLLQLVAWIDRRRNRKPQPSFTL